MFERLAGKLLTRLLSRYFVSPENTNTGNNTCAVNSSSSQSGSPSEKKSSSWTQLSVWSGYVSLENLELRTEVVNDYLRSKGLPLELVHCTIGRMEITVPWAKLGSTKSSSRKYQFSSSSAEDSSAVVVVVIDGIHALLRTQYEFDDEALRQAHVDDRRQELQDADDFGKTDNRNNNSSGGGTGVAGFFHKRLAEGILNDVLEKIHIHIRDLHVRLEDVNSDPYNPFACGITLESLHVQADDEEDLAVAFSQLDDDAVVVNHHQEAATTPTTEVIRKVAQLNHFAIYWNSLSYDDGMAPEFSVLQDITTSSPVQLSNLLDRCILRRASFSSSPSRHNAGPNHSYLLLPVDGTCHATLSTNPRNLELRPALVATVNIEAVSVQVRDFQCNQMVGLVASLHDHKFAKQYRHLRPRESVKENPRAWWLYALKIIQLELRESNMRWSWKRFHERFELRRRYCELYERQIRYPTVETTTTRRPSTTPRTNSRRISESSRTLSSREKLETDQQSINGDGEAFASTEITTPDEGAGPSTESKNRPLSLEEATELQEMEDGIRGDLSVRDIIFFRAVTNSRIAGTRTGDDGTGGTLRPRFKRMMSSMIGGDMKSEEEYSRLLAYLESASTEREIVMDKDHESLIAVSIQTQLKKGCVTCFSPLPSTSDLNQHRRLHERFLELRMNDLQLGYSLLGNYDSFQWKVSMADFVISEIRSDLREFVIVSRVPSEYIAQEVTDNRTELQKQHSMVSQTSSFAEMQDLSPLVAIEFTSKPPQSPECDIGLRSQVDKVEILLLPENEWLHRIKSFATSIPSLTKLAAFWEEMSMAHINSFESQVAGLLAKANTALYKHRNLDVDVQVNCPILRIGGGNGCNLAIDLGCAHFSTERLAGVATGKLNYSSLREMTNVSDTINGNHNGNGEVDRTETSPETRRGLFKADSMDSPSDRTTPNFGSSRQLDEIGSPRRSLDNFFLGSSAMSVDSRNRAGPSSRSLLLNESMRFSLLEKENRSDQKQAFEVLHSSFYDVFQLRLCSGTVVISDGDQDGQMTVMNRLDIRITFETSVIPADHTLCRLKANCAVDDIALTLSEAAIVHMGGMAKTWTQVLSGGPSSVEAVLPPGSKRMDRMTIRSELQSRIEPATSEIQDATSDSSSILDENEFFDALDDDDGNENTGWFDDNWIPNAESILDGDSTTLSQKQRRRRGSISEVSSLSDHSRRAGRRKHEIGHYLSAENLARLDERGAEDLSENESDLDSDTDSFHSAMSLGGQIELMNAINDDITRVEHEIGRLKNHILEDGGKKRRTLKLDLVRLEAELRALRATHHDLSAQVSVSQQFQDDAKSERIATANTPSESPLSPGQGSVKGAIIIQPSGVGTAARAIALHRARKERSQPREEQEGFQHTLTSTLNRELFRVSLVISRVSIELHEFGESKRESAGVPMGDPCVFELCMSQLALSMLRRVNDAKLYTSMENLSAAMKGTSDSMTPARYIFLAGVKHSHMDSLIPYQFPHHVASTTAEEKFLRIAIDIRRKRSASGAGISSFDAMKLRVRVGDVEISPNVQMFSALVSFGMRAKHAMSTEKQGGLSISDERHTTPFVIDRLIDVLMSGRSRIETQYTGGVAPCDLSSYMDISVRLSSIRLRLADEDSCVGAIVLTDTSVRFGRVVSQSVYKCRSQLDVRCSNMQLLEISEINGGKARELFGKREPYNPIVQMRLRTQYVPLSQEGGWVVERGYAKDEVDNNASQQRAWNLHCGLSVQSVHIIASRQAAESLCERVIVLLEALTSPSRQCDEEEVLQNEIVAQPSAVAKTGSLLNGASRLACGDSNCISIRWRFDVSLRKASIVFPSQMRHEWVLPEHTGSNILVSLSLNSCIEEAQQNRSALTFRCGITDLALLRSSDDWPLLEPVAVTCESSIEHDSLHERSFPPLQLRLPINSKWQGTIIETTQDDTDSNEDEWGKLPPDIVEESVFITLSVTMSPIRINLSAPACCLLIDTAKTLAQPAKEPDTTPVPIPDKERPRTPFHNTAKIRVFLHSFEGRLLREAANSTGMAYADPLASLIVSKVLISSSVRTSRADAFVYFNKVFVYDLSSLPGVRVLGNEDSSDADATKCPHFMTLSMNVFETQNSGVSMELELSWGRIQFLVLPSIIGSMLTFHSSLQGHAKESVRTESVHRQAKRPVEKDALQRFRLPFDARKVLVSVRTAGFECILSSRDIFSHIRDRSLDPINVVTFRWKSDVKAAIIVFDARKKTANGMMQALNAEEESLDLSSPFVEAPHVWQDFISRAVTLKVKLTVDDFQALRTSIRRQSQKAAAAGDKQMAPYSFLVTPPAAGEQRVTNPIKFKSTYRLVGTSLNIEDSVDPTGALQPRYPLMYSKISQALQLEAGFVDVLVYIRQSAGGMNDAYRVTVKPVFDMLHRRQETERPRKSASLDATTRHPYLSVSELMKNATTVCCVQAEGIQVTCVPGGATRLTESPIAKCALSNFGLGFAVISVPSDVDESASHLHRTVAGNDANNEIDVVVSSSPVAHLAAGAWVNCEISASYHNRRLVAWEPVVEPWILDARAGVDLVKLLRTKPSKWIEVSPWTTPSEVTAPSSFAGLLPDLLNERAGEKIRDFGRLLRSPFRGDGQTKQFTAGSLKSTVETHSDFCYWMLASIEPQMTALTLYPSLYQASSAVSPKSLSHQRKLSLLPGLHPIQWLRRFGFPPVRSRNGKLSGSRPAVAVSLSDVRPLNVNLTGALIDNLLVYMGQQKEETPRSRPLAPHWIRNDSGMTIRFREVLDSERLYKGEKTRKTTLSNGCEIPLSLKRAASQSCDPHRGHISLELGSFEDTAGRFNDYGFDVPKGSLSTSFRYRAIGKIPVDTVGVHKYSLDRNTESRAENQMKDKGVDATRRRFEWIIVRVALRGGIKVVSVESPFVLNNKADVDLVCEVRDHGVGLPLIWRTLIRRSSMKEKGLNSFRTDGTFVPVPVDVIPLVDDESAFLSVTALPSDSIVSHESELGDADQFHSTRIMSPPPYSQKSIRRGLIKVAEVSLEPSPSRVQANAVKSTLTDFVHLNVCSVRIGSFSLGGSSRVSEFAVEGAKSVPAVPEQRMLLLRPPVVIKNHLPVTIKVQVRVKGILTGQRTQIATAVSGVSHVGDEAVAGGLVQTIDSITEWEELGNLSWGNTISWTGAVASADVEIRVKICEKGGGQSREFPSWSTPVLLPTQDDTRRISRSGSADSTVSRLTVDDAFGVPLTLSVSLEGSVRAGDSDSAPQEDIRGFARSVPAASRVVGIYVPFWIVDSTGQDLEFSSNARVAGQLSRHSLAAGPSEKKRHLDLLDYSGHEELSGYLRSAPLGLAELLEDEKLLHLKARPSFDVLMIGDEKSNRLSFRRHMARLVNRDSRMDLFSSWSDPITLRAAENSHQDVSVFPPTAKVEGLTGTRSALREPLALRSRIVAAPEKFGGRHGTRLIHIVNRYAIVNELGREIEVVSDHGQGIPVAIGADGQPIPFHFDDSDSIRIRPKEFGWGWSGPFSLKKKRREVVLRLRHKLKGHAIIVSIEFYAGQNSPGNVLVFRTANHPPFRLENHTMHPLKFCQSSTLHTDDVSMDSMLLPYHSADFAWDEPDERRRSVVVEIVDFGHPSDPVQVVDGNFLGSFKLDLIAPGTELRLSNRSFSGRVVADGPTRVLRITDASLPRLPSNECEGADQTNTMFKKTEASYQLHQWIDLKLSHGVGISVVDWKPQELLYVRLDDICIERHVESGRDDVSIAIGSVSADNQLWVTPYPVLLKMGHSAKGGFNSTIGHRRRRRNNAIALSCSRALSSYGGHGDLTLLYNLVLSTESAIINVDGHLSDLIWSMAHQIAGTGTGTNENSMTSTSRDTELRKFLGMSDYMDRLYRQSNAADMTTGRGHLEGIGYSADDFLTTAAMAAKLRVKSQTNKDTALAVCPVGQPIGGASYGPAPASLPKVRRKYYIDRLRISTVNMEISWSGALPAAFFSVFGLMRPALTFEGLPVMLRQYTSSHAYGTVEDILQNLKSHYLSIWRIFDVLAGLAFKPTFLVRTCVYTTREGIATAFDWIGEMFAAVGNETRPVYRDGVLTERSAFARNILYRAIIGKTASLFADIVSVVASTFRYSGSGDSGGGRHATTSGSVRSRNPRLFENLDGNDLLVEYEEGENAGKALLSRVRMGMYLGEGYIYHMEGVHPQQTRKRKNLESGATPPILMMTSERVMLLNGDRDVNFCSVLWESVFDNIVFFELVESTDYAPYDLAKFWYLVDKSKGSRPGKSDDRLSRYAAAVVSGCDVGLDLLLCNSIYVPRENGAMMRDKISIIHRNVLEDAEVL